MKRLLSACFLLVGVSGDPTVEGPLGRITGRIQKVRDVEVESFLALPYAKPPLGELRFELPQPFGAIGDLEATQDPPACPQPNRQGIGDQSRVTSEDCLFLNVFRKKGTSKSDKKAVIAVIHGGGFVLGSSTEEMQSAVALAALGDVILVSINYRLGIFGFADMKEFAPGNLGLHDQRLALQWIQDHIQDFGGDPERVTAMGLSAGSMSLAAHIVTPVDTKNLFKTAVMDAGVVSSHSFFESSENSYERVKKIALRLGCPVDSRQMVECLRKHSVDELLPLSLTTTGVSGTSSFVATLDGKFIPHDVEEYMEKNSASLRKVRAIVGYAKDEGTFFTTTNFLEHDFPNPKTRDEVLEYLSAITSKYNTDLDLSDTKTRQLVGEHYVDTYPSSSFHAVAEFQADVLFKCPINRFVRSYSLYNDQVYVYHFERKLRSAFKILNPDLLGAFHYSPYLHFAGVLLSFDEVLDPRDELYSVDSVNMIAEFAKSDGAPAFRGLEWPSFAKSKKILIFNDVVSVRKGLVSEQICHELFVGHRTSHRADGERKAEL